jgi:hypothetical protein
MNMTGIVSSLNWNNSQLYRDKSLPEDFKDTAFIDPLSSWLAQKQMLRFHSRP